MTPARRGMLIPAVFALGGLAVLLSLGIWQLERKAWKETLIASLTGRLGAAPAELPPPPTWGSLTPASSEFLRVKLRADFHGNDALVYTSGSALRDDVKSPGYFVFALPGLTRQSIFLRKKMDARVKPAHDGRGKWRE